MRCRRSPLVAAVAVTVAVIRAARPRLATFPVRLRSWCAAPSPHRTDCCRSIRWRVGVKGGFACTLTRQFTCARCPAVAAALDAVPEACHNPAAVWWGAFAASAVIRDQVVTVKPLAGLPGQQRGCQEDALGRLRLGSTGSGSTQVIILVLTASARLGRPDRTHGPHWSCAAWPFGSQAKVHGSSCTATNLSVNIRQRMRSLSSRPADYCSSLSGRLGGCVFLKGMILL